MTKKELEEENRRLKEHVRSVESELHMLKQDDAFRESEVYYFRKLAIDRSRLITRLHQNNAPDICAQLKEKADEYYNDAQKDASKVSDFLRGALWGMGETLSKFCMYPEAKYCGKLGMYLRWQQSDQMGGMTIIRNEAEIDE